MIKQDMEQVLGPRLVVLVTTIDKRGCVNAAPVTWHSPISYEPPIVSVSLKPWTHTLENIRETGEFVLNQMMPEYVRQVCVCAERFDKGVNELVEAGLEMTGIVGFDVPRVKECENWLACHRVQELEKGDHVVVFGEVRAFELSTSCFDGLMYREKRNFALMGNEMSGG